MAKETKKTSQKHKHEDEPDETEVENEEQGEEAPEEAPATPDEEGKDAGEADTPPAASPHAVIVKGTGTLSIMADGKAHTIERGKKIKVSAELLEALRANSENVEEA